MKTQPVDSFKTVTASLIQHAVQCRVGRHESWMDEMRFTSHEAHEFRDMVYTLSAGIWAEDLGESRVEMKLPETWWDAFKLEKFPEWLKKRYPPKMRTAYLVCDVKAKMPLLDQKFRGDKATMFIAKAVACSEWEADS